jgi:7 transmembrane sweet-taste receptor of 3 GCPR
LDLIIYIFYLGTTFIHYKTVFVFKTVRRACNILRLRSCDVVAHIVVHDCHDSASPFSKAIQGIGLIQMSAGVSANRLTQGIWDASSFQENPATGFERFRLSWNRSLEDALFQQYVQSKLPESFTANATISGESYFLRDPISAHAFLYDSVTAFGVSMCHTNSSQNYFSGPEVFEHVRELNIEAASGNVRMTKTGTRNQSSVAFAMWNIRSVGVDSEGQMPLEFVPSHSYGTEKWSVLPGNEFQFADGSKIAPESLPPVSHDYNYITRSDRVFAYTLMSVVVAFSVGAIIWTIVYRKSHVIDAAQPLFLIIVFIGAIIMALTIIPASLDETTVGTINGLDSACMAVPWLYFIGSNLSSGALLAKTRAVYQVILQMC